MYRFFQVSPCLLLVLFVFYVILRTFSFFLENKMTCFSFSLFFLFLSAFFLHLLSLPFSISLYLSILIHTFFFYHFSWNCTEIRLDQHRKKLLETSNIPENSQFTEANGETGELNNEIDFNSAGHSSDCAGVFDRKIGFSISNWCYDWRHVHRSIFIHVHFGNDESIGEYKGFHFHQKWHHFFWISFNKL